MSQIYTLCFTVLLFYFVSTAKSERDNDATGIIDRQTRVAGGHLVSISKHPYLLSVFTYGELSGAAVIINKRWALTTGYNVHHVQLSDINLRAGSTATSSGGKTLKPIKIVLHPKYSGEWDYNLALVKLKTPLHYSRNVRAIRLSRSLPKEGSSAVVTGWGQTNFTTPTDGLLREAQVPIAYYKTCKKYYEQETSFTETSFCASKEKVGPCPIDFGDPLVYQNKLIGLFSGAKGCGNPDSPAVFVDVAKFADWIKDTVKNNAIDNQKSNGNQMKVEIVSDYLNNNINKVSDRLKLLLDEVNNNLKIKTAMLGDTLSMTLHDVRDNLQRKIVEIEDNLMIESQISNNNVKKEIVDSNFNVLREAVFSNLGIEIDKTSDNFKRWMYEVVDNVKINTDKLGHKFEVELENVINNLVMELLSDNLKVDEVGLNLRVEMEKLSDQLKKDIGNICDNLKIKMNIVGDNLQIYVDEIRHNLNMGMDKVSENSIKMDAENLNRQLDIVNFNLKMKLQDVSDNLWPEKDEVSDVINVELDNLDKYIATELDMVSNLHDDDI